ncbi:MAG: 4Fe-4S binding protein, partial [Neisseria sp.]|nr:4Fe-4S binding protein [Neisseria sp.]
MSTEPKVQPPKEQVVHLYEGGKRIHPKLAKGRFANWRIFAIVATQFVFYALPWFNWGGRQAVLFDIPERHFYIFGLSLGMGDLIYLAGLLIICAFGLFWWTTIAGRLWCGYACPQTVYTEIMLWIDHFIEGDRNKRLKLDKSPWNFTKIRIKATKYLLIFAVCAWTGITFAGWFT